MKQSLNGGKEEDSERNEGRIRKSLAKAVYINKNQLL